MDAANVVGSVPDGWWRDRRGAAERLRDLLAGYAREGLPAGAVEPPPPAPPEIVLVVEGAARGIAPVPGVGVEAAWGHLPAVAGGGSGDDRIVELVAARAPGRRCVVVTADRELRERVRALGAEVVGPRAVRP
ncbi:NTP pyrophosphohydrolase [Streptomyces sp. UNOB3_S3]|nr:NTP pyrophosphohydrolase [Streptomyces sp. UNOB3_S3]